MLNPAEIPIIILLVAGVALLMIGYFLGGFVQAIEDGLWLIAIRWAGYLLIGYIVLRVFLGPIIL